MPRFQAVVERIEIPRRITYNLVTPLEHDGVLFCRATHLWLFYAVMPCSAANANPEDLPSHAPLHEYVQRQANRSTPAQQQECRRLCVRRKCRESPPARRGQALLRLSHW